MDIPKYMVLPEEREKDFQRKMESPLFSQHFNDEGWQLLYFDALRRAFAGSLEKTDIESLIGVKSPQKDKSKSKHSSQMTLGF
jgi:hypothetical protein